MQVNSVAERVFRELLEEIVVQDDAELLQQFGVDVFTGEDVVDVGALAGNLL